jgi:type I restriction enzyme, S subunit
MKQGWKIIKLGDLIKRADRFEKKSPFETYSFSGTYSYAKGIFKSYDKKGSEFNLDKIQRIKEGDFVFCKIMAWEGAFGLTPKECDDTVMSGAFVAYEIDKSKLFPKFLDYYFQIERVWREAGGKSSGTNVRRKTLYPADFEDYEIPLPPLSEQQRITGRLAALKGKIDAVRGLRGEQEKEMKGLLLMQYQKIIEGAEWKPLKEVAPLMRRKVDLQPNTVYSEIGVRSFGKGIFEKPSFNSDELSWEKPNWIEEGDLLMSNIKAWEGAVAAVGKEHDGKVGSHRYLTFVPYPEITNAKFLAFYFLTEAGNLKLSEASPGSADRNRTLNTKIILNTLVPVPDPELQKEFLQLQTKMDALKAAQAGQMSALEGLFPGVLEQAFRGEW